MAKTTNPELIDRLSDLNNALFNLLVKADRELEKGINKAKGLDLIAGERILKEGAYDKLQKTRKNLTDYLASISAKAEETLNAYKKR